MPIPGTYAKLAGGYMHTYALKADDTLWAWGHNGNGQFAQGNATPRSSPVQIKGSWAQVTGAVHCGFGIKK